ncbi:phytanoyl-CoA dioxygenase family protein [Saccharothrix algeriensis]|uniref:Ectoine hydroxylase n=1 Tax=Saccharothrix algeriensis TaxID=173560 RepID=A0ABS2SET8_9PSEU|nr:phytanoyl-CoA dioxygenase family protein [Saccharothrix algeriensis]MBM7814474.1 ectoine hydroxylase [Saccharothrix algeriensis]
MRALETNVAEVVEAYRRQGWAVLAHGIDPLLLADLRATVSRICGMVRPEVVHEEDGETVRALHGCHRFDDVCERLVRHPLFVDLAEAAVGDSVYVYQFKINIKSPREGKRWPWHQDFAFWAVEDGMPEPDAVNIAINLDEVHERNGPLTVLTGSHRLGLVGPPAGSGSAPSTGWQDHVSANLTHSVDDAVVRELAAEHPPTRLLGPAGTISLFHPSIVHSSSDNLSDDRRTMLFITYNSVRNAPRHVTRPSFLVDPDTTAVTRLGA